MDGVHQSAPLSRRRATFATLASIGLAALIWLPCLSLIFRPSLASVISEKDIPKTADALAKRQLQLWSAAAERARGTQSMRRTNAEWDFMGRTYLVLAWSNMALREPTRRPELLAAVDRVIDDTLELEQRNGMLYFLMPYARARPFVAQPARSLFVDGEIALMLAARCLVESKSSYRRQLRARVQIIVERMQQAPLLNAESYPDECWLFCNTVALVAVRMADYLDGGDHRAFFSRWVATAKAHLIDSQTGLLQSSYSLKGRVRDGPEGSSIWMAVHCLKVIAPAFAQQQYQLARDALGRDILGFGYAREWPTDRVGPRDVDSGPVVPLLEASPASSGLALLAAASFEDSDFFLRLTASLNFAAFPMRDDGELSYAASNLVGDAVMLYAMVEGPLFDKVALEDGGVANPEGAR